MAETAPARQWVVIDGGLAQDQSQHVDVLDLDTLDRGDCEPDVWQELYRMAKEHKIEWALADINRLTPDSIHRTLKSIQDEYNAIPEPTLFDDSPMTFEDYIQDMLSQDRIHPDLMATLL